MGNGLKVASFFQQKLVSFNRNGSKVTPLLYESNLPTTVCLFNLWSLIFPFTSPSRQQPSCYVSVPRSHARIYTVNVLLTCNSCSSVPHVFKYFFTQFQLKLYNTISQTDPCCYRIVYCYSGQATGIVRMFPVIHGHSESKRITAPGRIRDEGQLLTPRSGLRDTLRRGGRETTN